MCHISGTVRHMVFVTLVLNDDIPRHFFHFFEIFIFRAVREVKGRKYSCSERKKKKVHLNFTP